MFMIEFVMLISGCISTPTPSQSSSFTPSVSTSATVPVSLTVKTVSQSPSSQSYWMHIDPIGEHHQGETFNITGTTNIPADETISLFGGTQFHSCTQAPSINNSGSFCGNDCRSLRFNVDIPVVAGAGGNNTWTFTVNTTNVCVRDNYGVTVYQYDMSRENSEYKEFRILP